jgi:hypothetical protein
MTAHTDNPKVDVAVFKWYAPNSDIDGAPTKIETATEPIEGSFTSSQIVNEVGEWTIVVTFKNQAGTPIYQDSTTKVKFVMIGVGLDVFQAPEYPILGTAGITIAVFAALAVVKRKESTAKFHF